MAPFESDLGIHFIVGLAGSALEEPERTLLSELRPAGIIIFAHNIDEGAGVLWPEKLRSLILEAKIAAGRSDFIASIDHEGGRVHRLRSPATHFPAAANWGEQAAAVGQAIGRELHALGFNLDFAPVVDVLSEPTNKVIGDRAFSASPQAVSESAAAFLAALERTGIIGCAKHFPGHGGTAADSHFELPVVNASLNELKERDLQPFRKMIAAGVKLVMTGHLLVPALDPTAPATVSPLIIKGLLRDSLGFHGAVISDALEMKAMDAATDAHLPARLLNAGVDMLLVAKPEAEIPATVALELLRDLKEAVKDRSVARDVLEMSRTRIVELLRQAAAAEASVPASHSAECLGCCDHLRLAETLRPAQVKKA